MKKKNILTISLMSFLSLTIMAFTNITSSSIDGEVKDIDGNIYKTVKIGGQEWMAENLNVSHFNNGDEIPEVKTAEEWKKACEEKQPAWCYYEFNSSYEKSHGKLYNQWAVSDERGIAPAGCHASTTDDWQGILKMFKPYKGSSRSYNGGKEIRSINGWEGKGAGNNEYGLNIKPTGSIKGDNPEFRGGKGKRACFYGGRMNENVDVIVFEYDIKATNIFNSQSNQGFSVRCVKD